MEPREVIENLKTALAEVKTRGEETVAISALEKYLEDMHTGIGMSMELHKLEYQRTLTQYDAKVKQNLEMFKSVIEAGREALKAILLVNGGAVVALLGFMGAVLSNGYPASLGLNLTCPLLIFGTGVLLSAMGFGARYFAQGGYVRLNKCFGHFFNILSIIFALGAYTAFGWGLYEAYRAFVVQFKS